MLAIESIPHAHINNITYRYRKFSGVKQEILSLTQSRIRIYKKSISLDKEFLDLFSASNIYGSQEFLEEYNNAITEILYEMFDDTSNKTEIINRIFSAKGDIYFTSVDKIISSKSNIYGNGPAEQWVNYVEVLRNMLDRLGVKISYKREHPDEFFEKLSKKSKNSSLANTCNNLAAASKQIRERGVQSGIKTSNNGAFNIGGMKKLLKGNLSKVFGEWIWERITLKAREEALNIFFRENQKIQDQLRSKGFIVTTDIKQTGSNTSKKTSKQRIEDSMTSIQIRDASDGHSIVATISSYDSTKFRQSYLLAGGQGNWKSNNITRSYYLGNLLFDGEIKSLVAPNSVSILQQNSFYWKERLGVYLTSDNRWASNMLYTKSYNDLIDTMNALRDLTWLDTIAVRESYKPVQTLSLNEKIYTIEQLLQKNNWTNNKFTVGSSSIVDLYNNYIKKQKSDNIKNKNDQTAINNYKELIASIYNKKITISTDMFKLTGYLLVK